MNKNKHDLTGQRFGKWIVVSRADRLNGRHDARWLCKCDCGSIRNVLAFTLKNGSSPCCGCQRTKALVKRAFKHGEYTSKLYKVWTSAKGRCSNPNQREFHNYGGRGITMADCFKKDFLLFKKELGPKPTPKHTVDRIDNNKGYEPGNIRWATMKEQAHNKRVKIRS